MSGIFSCSRILSTGRRVAKIPNIFSDAITIGAIKSGNACVSKINGQIGTAGIRADSKVCFWLFEDLNIINIGCGNIATVLCAHRNYKLPGRQLAATGCKHMINRIYRKWRNPGNGGCAITKIPGVSCAW